MLTGHVAGSARDKSPLVPPRYPHLDQAQHSHCGQQGQESSNGDFMWHHKNEPIVNQQTNTTLDANFLCRYRHNSKVSCDQWSWPPDRSSPLFPPWIFSCRGV